MTTTAWDDPRIARGMTAQLAARRARIDRGETPLGWKVGFGAPAAMAKFNITGPLIGYLMQRALVPSGAAASLTGWVKPIAEPEIAVHLGTDLPADGSREAAAAAIAALGPAIELADADLPFDDPEAILKGNIFQRHVVLGPKDTSRAGGKVSGLLGRVHRNGTETARTSEVEANTGAIVGIVRHVADVLPHFGERLRAGDIIICGSIVPPIFLGADDARLDYALDPVGEVAVSFTR